jgi:glycosyltransferase involved in cell wall biosynthesis
VRIVVVGGVCVESDAISSALLAQAETLAAFPDVQSVTIITQSFDRTTDLDVIVVRDAWSFLRLPAVIEADLVILHWGIRYPLFDALPALAATTRSVVHFHNVTPPELVPEGDRPNLEASIEQIQLLHLVDSEIWTESAFNARTLTSWGIDPARIAFMPFPITPPRRIHPSARNERVRLLSVGRLTPAKGTDVLIEAMVVVAGQMTTPPMLTIVGNHGLSDAEFIDTITERLDSVELVGLVDIVSGADDDALWSLFEQADIVVSPSRHEGLCVPVIEAYIAGCRVIGTDAGNLPYVVQAPDPIVPVGDPAALADAIIALVDEVAAGLSTRPPGADRLVECFSSESVARRLRDAVTATDATAYASTSWIDNGMSMRTGDDD